MEYARLGSTGMKVSRICLGCMGFGDATRWVHKWVLDEASSRPIIKHALELGINFFDTANVYSIGASEEILGRALKDFAKRDEVVIATKVHGKMSDDELKAIFAYLRSLPAASHRVDNTESPTVCKLCKGKHGFGDRN